MKQMNLREKLLKELNLCLAIADDILLNNKSREVKMYAKKFAEIWDPLDDGKEGDELLFFVRSRDVLVHIYRDGSFMFELDPPGGGFGGVASSDSKEDFMRTILNLEAPVIKDGVTVYDKEDGYTDNIPQYIPYNPENNDIDFDKMIEIIHNAPISHGYAYDGSVQIKRPSYIITQEDMVKLFNYVRSLK